MAICMSGLDLSGIKWETPEPKPKKRGPKPKRSSLGCPMYMPDIAAFISPVGAKPELISSRKHLRDHERAYGIFQAGDIKPGEVSKRNIAKKKALEEKAKGVTLEWA